MEGFALKHAAQTVSPSVQEVPSMASVPWAELCTTQLHWRDIFDVMPVGILLLDKHGVVTGQNRCAQSLLAISVLGRRWFEVIAEQFTEQAVLGGDIVTQAGRTLSISTAAMQDSHGQVVALLDVTESTKLQQQLHHMERLSAVGKMSASLAHQIRTPLSSALLYAEHLQDQTLTSDMHAKFSSKLIDRLQNIEIQIKDMLLYCSKDNATCFERLTVTAFVTTLQNSIESAINCQVDSHVESMGLMVCNPVALTSAIQNCIDNAIQAQATQIHIQLNLFEATALAISITDDGCGMTSAQCQKARQAFYTTRSAGTGLGLAVVQSVVDMHQGQLHIDSTEGVGTQIQLHLPILQEPKS